METTINEKLPVKVVKANYNTHRSETAMKSALNTKLIDYIEVSLI